MNTPTWLSCHLSGHDPSDVDVVEHSAFLLDRLMPHTDQRVVSWLVDTYGGEALSEYLFGRGARSLGPRALKHWCMYLNVDTAVCDQWLAAARSRLQAVGVAPP